VSDIVFSPWVGKQYGRSSTWGLSVLLLGFSHYDEGFGQGHDLTQWVIERHIRREGKQYAFWTKIGRTLAGPAYDAAATREAFWNSVAFYNYIQSFVGTGPRQSPDRDDFRASWPAFLDTIQALAPDVIVGLGTGLWDELTPLLPERHRLVVQPIGSRVPEYVVLPQATPGAGVFGYVRHPSTSYSPPAWGRWVAAMGSEASRRVASQ
jgi:hypothetical protein